MPENTHQSTHKFIQNLLKIVGHDDSEIETYTNQMLEIIFTNALSLLMIQAKADNKPHIIEELKAGKTPEDTQQTLSKYFQPDDLALAFAKAGQVVLGDYLTSIEKTLNDEQKQQIQDLFVNFTKDALSGIPNPIE